MSAKEITLKPINSKIANEFVKKHHYSWKVVNNSQLHFGVFYKKQLGWVMSYWPSMDKRRIIWLVEGTEWNEFIELNRMAFSEFLPRNSESRAIAISLKLIKKQAPQIKWVISFADGTQCWDWTIYRAAWFELTHIKKNVGIVELNNGDVTHLINKKDPNHDIYKYWVKRTIDGYMLRYIKLLKPWLKRNYKIIPYDRIQEIGARMYLWKKI